MRNLDDPSAEVNPNQKLSLAERILYELEGERKLAVYHALEKLRNEIERLYRAKRYDHLIDPKYDWPVE